MVTILKIKKKIAIFLDFRSGPDPESDSDPLFSYPDPKHWYNVLQAKTQLGISF